MEERIQIVVESVFKRVIATLVLDEKVKTEHFREILMASYANGETIYQATRKIDLIGKGNFKVPSESIVHSAFIAANNAVALESFRNAGFTKKQWLTARDNKVRPHHQILEGNIVGLDEPFKVGNSLLMFPAEPSPNFEDWTDCRCTILAIE